MAAYTSLNMKAHHLQSCKQLEDCDLHYTFFFGQRYALYIRKHVSLYYFSMCLSSSNLFVDEPVTTRYFHDWSSNWLLSARMSKNYTIHAFIQK